MDYRCWLLWGCAWLHGALAMFSVGAFCLWFFGPVEVIGLVVLWDFWVCVLAVVGVVVSVELSRRIWTSPADTGGRAWEAMPDIAP